MRIKFIKSPQALGFGYFADDEIECEDKQAKEFIGLKYAVQVEADKPRSEIGIEQATEPGGEKAVIDISKRKTKK